MNNKNFWYIGYVLALLLVILLAVTNFPSEVDLGIGVLFSIIFSVSHVQILHAKMLKKDSDYQVEILDERNVAIKEKAGNATNIITLLLMSLVVVIFIGLDYIVPAVILGAIVVLQPILMILISTYYEKRM